MDHRVEGERDTESGHDPSDLELLRKRALKAADQIVHPRRRCLKRELNVVESGFRQCSHPPFIETDPRGDEIGIDAESGAMTDDRFDILARGRLAARQVNLSNAQPIRLRQHAQPCPGIELGRTPVELGRVRAIGAAQGTAMSQFRKHADGCCACRHISTNLLAARPLKNSRTSRATSSRWALNVLARSSTIASRVELPSQRFKISSAIPSGLRMRSGASSVHSERTSS